MHDLCLAHLPVLLDLAEAGLAAQERIAKLEAERERLRSGLLKAFTVVEWVVGEGYLLLPPYYDADALLLELAPLLDVNDSEKARAARA